MLCHAKLISVVGLDECEDEFKLKQGIISLSANDDAMTEEPFFTGDIRNIEKAIRIATTGEPEDEVKAKPMKRESIISRFFKKKKES